MTIKVYDVCNGKIVEAEVREHSDTSLIFEKLSHDFGYVNYMDKEKAYFSPLEAVIGHLTKILGPIVEARRKIDEMIDNNKDEFKMLYRLKEEILKGSETDKFCPPDCEFMNINEEDQEMIKKLHNECVSHICIKYEKKLKHNGSHPEIPKLKECMEEK